MFDNMSAIIHIICQYNSRHVIKNVTLKFKNGTFSIKVEYLIVLTFPEQIKFNNTFQM